MDTAVHVNESQPHTPIGRFLRTTADWLERVILSLVNLLLGTLVVVVFIQVVSRYILRVPTVWTQEAAMFCFLWSVFLAATIGLRRRRHFVFDILPQNHPVVRLISELGMLGLAVTYAWVGTRVALLNYVLLSQPSEIPMTFFMAAIPASGYLMIFFLLESAINEPWRRPREDDR